MNKKTARLRRSRKSRAKIVTLHIPRLSVTRSSQHISAQVFSLKGDRVLVSATSKGKSFKAVCEKAGNCVAASEVGKLIAQRAKDAGIVKVAFDRSGFQYHGRVKALAEAAREGGLEF